MTNEKSYSNVGSSKCLKACTETFKSSLVQIIGPSAQTETELLAPFHSMIAKSRTNGAANRKIEWVCFAVNKFDTCSKRCPANNAKALRMASILQWNTICNASKEDPKAFTEFVNCERHHIDKTSKKCNFVKANEQMALKDFCKQLADYSACYASVPFECSPRASDVWLKINHAIQRSFNVLLQLSSQHLQLPSECQASMATTLPAGILTTHHPPLVTTSPNSATVPTTTPMPLYVDDSSTADDYSYFTQTDDYKYFGIEREATITTEASREEPGGIDYWVDLGEESGDILEKPNQSHSQRHVEPPKNTVENDEDEIIFAEPARFDTRTPSSLTKTETTPLAGSQITRAPDSLNSGNFATYYWLLLFLCLL